MHNTFNPGANDGVWEYINRDGSLLCYVVRYAPKSPGQRKQYSPWTYQNDKWVKKYFVDSQGETLKTKPIYGMQKLTQCPEKPILIVEGEKAADAGQELFPEFNVISWMGGAGSVKNVDITDLKDKTIYLLPDNDENGYKAMNGFKSRLSEQNNTIYFVDIGSLSIVPKKWDLADFNEGAIDFEDLKLLFEEAEKVTENNFKMINSKDFPDLSEKDRPLNTTDNIAYLLNHFNISVKYNLMTNYPEFHAADKTFSLVNEADCFFTEISNLCIKNGVPKIDLYAHLNLISERNRYHPAIEFIESKPWDGISRINDLLNTISSPKQELSNKLIYRWLISCVAALYLPEGIASEGALVLQGKQKIGKTYWLLKLVPISHRYLVKEGVSINVTNKDDLMKATNVWIAELGEIASTFKKSDIDELKNFLTSSYDEYRVPFGRFSKKCPRRTIFYGSVNNQHFLADETGNRRYWTVPVNTIDYNHDIDMQQLWAEIKNLYDKGESYRLTLDEQNLLNTSNQDHECINPLKELLLNNYHWDSSNRRWMTITQIIIEMELTIDKNKTNNLANILRELNIDNKRSNSGLKFLIPHKKSPHLLYL